LRISRRTISIDEKQLKKIPCINQSTSGIDHGIITHDHFPYSWIHAVVMAISEERPSFLFTQLPRDCDVLHMLTFQIELGLDDLPSVSLNNLIERLSPRSAVALVTAVLLAVAIANGQFFNVDVHHDTRLIDALYLIFTDPNTFNCRLRHHTWTIIQGRLQSQLHSEQWSQ
jgi:hypothetical protein